MDLIGNSLPSLGWSDGELSDACPSTPFGIECEDDSCAEDVIEALPGGAKLVRLLMNSASIEPPMLEACACLMNPT